MLRFCRELAVSDSVSLRFANVYGPMSFHKGSVVAAFMRRILSGMPLIVHGDGKPDARLHLRDDLCEGIVAAMGAGESGVSPAFGSGVGTPLNRLIEAISHVVGPDFRPDVLYQSFRAGEVLHTWTDVSKAREKLGWTPRTALPDGLTRTWSWFRDHPANVTPSVPGRRRLEEKQS